MLFDLSIVFWKKYLPLSSLESSLQSILFQEMVIETLLASGSIPKRAMRSCIHEKDTFIRIFSIGAKRFSRCGGQA